MVNGRKATGAGDARAEMPRSARNARHETPRLFIVIPAKNEGATIAAMIARTRDICTREVGLVPQFLIVSDSRDNTESEAAAAGAIVVHGEGKGLGAAMYKGLKESVRHGADYIATIDADGQFDPTELAKVVVPCLQGKADLVLGSRFLGGNHVLYKMPAVNRFGNWILSKMTSFIVRRTITDAQTGYRCMRAAVAESLEMYGSHTYVQETIIDAAQKNFRVLEVPAVFHKREHGGSKVVSSWPRYAIWTMPILIMRAGIHMAFFPVFGMLLVLLGMLLGIYLLLWAGFDFARLYDRIPALLLVVLMVLSGLQMFFLGYLLNATTQTNLKIDSLIYKRHEK